MSWKITFSNQVATGKYWKELFKDSFDEQRFLTRSDAVYICKEAQADAYDNIMTKLEEKVDPDVINKLKKELWDSDDSALGIKKKQNESN